MNKESKRQSATSKAGTCISPMQLEQCIALLKLQQDNAITGFFRGAFTTTVLLYPLDHHTCDFEVTRYGGPFMAVHITGALERWEGTSTRITYRSKIDDSVFGISLILMLIVIGLPLGILNLLLAENLRHRLVKSIIEILLAYDT